MINNINSRYIPVTVIDTKTGISSEYVSIAEAARFFRTYPKAIWRKVHSGKLYKGRYYIKATYYYKSPMVNFNFSLYTKYINIIHNKILSVVFVFNKNWDIILYVFLWILFLSIILYHYIFYVIIKGIDIYYSNFPKFIEMDFDTLCYMLQNESKFININNEPLIDNTNAIYEFNKKWKYEYVCSNNIKDSIDMANNKVSYYQYLINKTFIFINSFFSNSIAVSSSLNSLGGSTVAPNSPPFAPSPLFTYLLNSVSESPSSSAYFFSEESIKQINTNVDSSAVITKEVITESFEKTAGLLRTTVNETVDNTTIFSNTITKPNLTIIDSSGQENSSVVKTPTRNLYNNHRHFNVIDRALYGPNSPGKRLLNYESNILYCLINGLSSPNLPRA